MSSLVKRLIYPSLGNDSRLAFLLLFPAVAYLVLVMVLPLSWAVSISFTNKYVGRPAQFNGLENYIKLMRDPIFFRAIWNTLVFTFFAVGFKVIFGVCVALILNEPIKARNVYRSLLLLPWTLPAVVVIYTWQWMYSDVGGVINDMLKRVGIIEGAIGWLSQSGPLAMFSVIVVNVWRGTPFICISALAGLQTIPGELYESATIDGANSFQKFFKITLPYIKTVLMLAALVTTIWTLNNFVMIWLLTAGGPGNATHIIATYSYLVGFTNRLLGQAIAVTVFTMPFIILLVNFITRLALQED